MWFCCCCCADSGLIHVLVRCYEALRVHCADAGFGLLVYLLWPSWQKAVIFLSRARSGGGGVQVLVDLLCQQFCKLPAWPPASASLPPVSFAFSLLLSYFLSLWRCFTAGLCFPMHFGREGGIYLVIRQQSFLPCVSLDNWFSVHPAEKIICILYPSGHFFVTVVICMFSFLFSGSWLKVSVRSHQWQSYLNFGFFAFVCVGRLHKSGGADHGARPLCRGADVRNPPRFEPHQRPPEAAALRLHRQRWRSPGLKEKKNLFKENIA